MPIDLTCFESAQVPPPEGAARVPLHVGVERVRRVCDVVQFHSPISGGIRRYIEDKARSFAGADDLAHAVLIPGPEDATWRSGNTTWVQVASPMMPGSKSYRLLLNRGALRRFLDGFQPQVIEVADPYQTAWMSFGWARRHGAKVVLFYHSDYPRAWHRSINRYAGRIAAAPVQATIGVYLRRLLDRADTVLVSTRKFERLWNRQLHVPVRRVPPGVDVGVFYPRPDAVRLRRELGLQPGEKLVFYAGRLAPEKRLNELLHAFARFHENHPEAKLVIAGDGEEKERLRLLAEKLCLPVRWLPFLNDRDELARHYSAADVLAHPGANETYGLSVLEAGACGTPSLIFAGSGLEESALLHAGSRIVPRRSAGDFADGLRSFLGPSLSWQQRQLEHRAVATQASLAVTCARLRACYDQMETKKPGGLR